MTTPQKLSLRKINGKKREKNIQNKNNGNSVTSNFSLIARKPARWGRIRFLGGVHSQMNWQKKENNKEDKEKRK